METETEMKEKMFVDASVHSRNNKEYLGNPRTKTIVKIHTERLEMAGEFLLKYAQLSHNLRLINAYPESSVISTKDMRGLIEAIRRELRKVGEEIPFSAVQVIKRDLIKLEHIMIGDW